MTAPGEDEETAPPGSTDEATDPGSPPAEPDADVGLDKPPTGTTTESDGHVPGATSNESPEQVTTPADGQHESDQEFASRLEQDETQSDSGEGATWALFTRDIVMSVLAVVLLGLFLFAMSGVWPPMVAIESGSMSPNMEVNDLVFLMEPDRFQPDEAQAGTGVVTAAAGSEASYDSYGDSGDVIVFAPNGNENTTPIIHRAMFWVEEGENWCEQAESQYLGSLQPDDDACIAPNDGFITKGDNNNRYDQASLQADRPVKPEWVVGTAEARIPGLGWFRLRFQ